MLWLAALAVFPLTPAHALSEDDRATFTAVGDWRVSAGSESCAARRVFTDGEKTLSLTMRRYHPGARTQLSVIGDRVRWKRGKVTLAFSPHEDRMEVEEIARARLGGETGIAFVIPARYGDDTAMAEKIDNAAWFAAVENISLDNVGGDPIALQSGPLAAPLAQVNECLIERLQSLGVDPETQRNLKIPARVDDSTSWIENMYRAYPMSAARRGFEGNVRMRLVVDENGSVIDCQEMDMMRAKSLRDAACGLMLEFARYRPAMSSEGKAVTSYIMFEITFVLDRR